MAMSVVYATINGQIVSENRGGVISYYAPDNLGSTVALLDTTGTVTDRFTYWPYGEIQSHVVSSVTPFTFCGTLGYYLDVLGSQIYVRARYLRQALTRWLTVDPVWPSEAPYTYVRAEPTLYVDPRGTSAVGLIPVLSQPSGGGCKVWICHANHIFGHGFVDVSGPGGGCGGSRDPSSFYSCQGAHDQPDFWECSLVSTDCNYAGNVCACIKASSGGSPFLDWCKAGGCKQFATNMICCGCHGLPPGQRESCEAKNCALAFQTPPSGPWHTGGGGCGRPLI